MLANLSLEYCIVKDIQEKAIRPVGKRELVDFDRKQFQISLMMACRALGIGESVYCYRPDPHRDDEAIAKSQEAVERYYAAQTLKTRLELWRSARSN
ncbi:hypothetical protein ACEQ4U_003687 [Vibrio mimicus]